MSCGTDRGISSGCTAALFLVCEPRLLELMNGLFNLYQTFVSAVVDSGPLNYLKASFWELAHIQRIMTDEKRKKKEFKFS